MLRLDDVIKILIYYRMNIGPILQLTTALEIYCSCDTVALVMEMLHATSNTSDMHTHIVGI